MKNKIIVISILCVLSSCSYFRVIPVSNYSSLSLKEFEDKGKYIILHRGNQAWHVYDLVVDEEKVRLKLDFQLGYHVDYLNPKKESLNQYYRKSQPEVGNSLHLYTNDTVFSDFDTLITIPVSSIYRIDSYEYAKTPSRASKIIPAIFVPILVIVIYGGVSISMADWYG